MQKKSAKNIISIAREENTTKTSWHRPSISRIDIKRTLTGSGPSTDGVAGGFTT